MSDWLAVRERHCQESCDSCITVAVAVLVVVLQ